MLKSNIFCVLVASAIFFQGCRNTDAKKETKLSVDDLYKGDLNPMPVAQFNDFKKNAEKGDAAAQDSLGQCYTFGSGVNIDFDKAEIWFKKSAEQGNTDAMYRLYRYYFSLSDSADVEKNKIAALFLNKAAEKGNAQAQTELGENYFRGYNVFGQSFSDAEKWITKGAEAGNQKAQNLLGNSYYSGNFTNKNKDLAIKWLQKAIENKDTTYTAVSVEVLKKIKTADAKKN